MISPSAVTNYSNIFLFCFVFDILEPADRFISNYLQHYHQCKPISQSVLISALFASPFLLSSLPSPAPTLRVSTQSGRRNEDHEHREAAEDYPHYSEPDGRPSRFQCEFKVKPPPPPWFCSSCSKKLLIWSVQSAPRLLYFPNSEADFLFFVWQQIAVQKL